MVLVTSETFWILVSKFILTDEPIYTKIAWKKYIKMII